MTSSILTEMAKCNTEAGLMMNNILLTDIEKRPGDQSGDQESFNRDCKGKHRDQPSDDQ